MKKLILLLFSIILLGSACKKERPIPELYLDQAVKDYMYFKKGTWWIYTDTATGESEYQKVLMDTLYMFEEIAHHSKNNKVIDKRETFIWQTNDYRYLAQPETFDTTGTKITDMVTLNALLTLDEGFTIVFFFPFINKTLQPHGLTTVSLYGIYDTLKILGINYFNVVAFHETSNSMENGYETITYIGKHYGIIRKNILIEGVNGQPDKWKYLLLTDSEIIQ